LSRDKIAQSLEQHPRRAASKSLSALASGGALIPRCAAGDTPLEIEQFGGQLGFAGLRGRR